LRQNVGPGQHCEITNEDASQIHRLPVFAELGEKVSLVVTSPPYPGVHVLYHRWQVDGRRETPAPYWIAGMQDGQAESYYNLGDRKEAAANSYFEASLRNLRSVRTVMKRGAFMVQMLAFAEPARQLPRYLATMEAAGFAEILPDPTVATETRIWRNVPNRKWYASIAGKTHSSKEVVLIHKTI
jgi:DNA modification methylase